MSYSFNQKIRIIFLFIYIILLSLLSRIIFGFWVPPFTDQGLWFFSGLAALLLSSLLETPFYVAPKDAIAYGIASISAILAVVVWPESSNQTLIQLSKLAVIGFSSTTLFLGLIAILLNIDDPPFYGKISNLARIIASKIGDPKFLYSLVFIFSISILNTNPENFFILVVVWFLIIGFEPIENIAYLVVRFKEIFFNSDKSKKVGDIIGYQSPKLLIFRIDENVNLSFGDLLLAKTENNEPGVGIVIDHIGYVDASWIRALVFVPAKRFHDEVLKYSKSRSVIKPDLSEMNDLISFHKGKIEDIQNKMIGLVTRDSNIHTLKFEITKSDVDIQEGRLVTTTIRDKNVIYQIINGFTQEEILQQKNTHGFVCAEGKKIGIWNEDNSGFESVKWLPEPNQPVYIIDEKQGMVDPNAIGYFPGTDYPVGINNINELVTHNTAILGILGIGKTFLALELIERMIDEGIKVICLDLTDQYSNHLGGFIDNKKLIPNIKVLQAKGKQGETNVQRNVHEGGSINQFANELKTRLAEFLDEDNEDMLQVYNPSEFLVWRQDSKPFEGRASMALLTPPQIAKIFTEVVLEIRQSHGMCDEAKCCLVFEEAHSLVPEWNSIVDEGDKNATNGTARAILQGRKFGLGCLLITQRTANVTKSILNQCNTIFALRVFDETGMNFLKNYIGPGYSNVLSNLEERHAVYFGKASTCKEPVLVRLNDRDNFISSFRESVEKDDPDEIPI